MNANAQTCDRKKMKVYFEGGAVSERVGEAGEGRSHQHPIMHSESSTAAKVFRADSPPVKSWRGLGVGVGLNLRWKGYQSSVLQL